MEEVAHFDTSGDLMRASVELLEGSAAERGVLGGSDASPGSSHIDSRTSKQTFLVLAKLAFVLSASECWFLSTPPVGSKTNTHIGTPRLL